jgi:hypothetical protein
VFVCDVCVACVMSAKVEERDERFLSTDYLFKVSVQASVKGLRTLSDMSVLSKP